MSNELIHAVVDDVVAIRPITGKGTVNCVYDVKRRVCREIFRVSKDAYAQSFEKEVWCMNIANQLGVATIGGVQMGIYKEIEYMRYEYVVGDDGNGAGQSVQEYRSILGHIAKQIHSMSIDQLKELGCGESGIEIQDVSAQIEYNIQSLGDYDPLRALGVLDNTQSHKIQSYFEQLQLCNYTLGLIHGDLSLKNLLIDTYNTSHIIDRGSAKISASPRCDFAEILQCHINNNEPGAPLGDDLRSFLLSYGILERNIEDTFRTTAKWVLLETLDTVRWAIDRAPERVERYASTAQKRISFCLHLLDK